MTTTLIKEQVKIIENATKAASKSKESAIKFLKDAGIITPHRAKVLSTQKDKK